MIVIDASAMLKALVGGPEANSLRHRILSSGERLYAPFVIDLEIVQSLRRLVRQGEISETRAAEALDDYQQVAIIRSEHAPFLHRIWALRDNLTAYDAAYVALSELLEAPLLTSDVRLAQAPVHEARTELV